MIHVYKDRGRRARGWPGDPGSASWVCWAPSGVPLGLSNGIWILGYSGSRGSLPTFLPSLIFRELPRCTAARLGRWTLLPSALDVRLTSGEKAIQGNFYRPTMRMQGIGFTPFVFFFNTMFPNEQLAFAQFISGEHSALLGALCVPGHPRSLPGTALPAASPEARPLQPAVGAGFPAEALGRDHACSAARAKLGRWQRDMGTPGQGPSQVQRPQFTCLCWGPSPLVLPLCRQVFKWQKLAEALKIVIWIIST